MASLEYGIDDSLSSGDVRLSLVRFVAQGEVKDEKALVWDFGDGSKGTGRTVTHVYLKDGDYTVSLQSVPGVPPFRRTVAVWRPGATSPLSLGVAIRAIAASDWRKSPADQVRPVIRFSAGLRAARALADPRTDDGPPPGAEGTGSR